MAAFAVYIHEKIGLSSNLAKHLQNQNPLDDNRLRVLNEPRIEDGLQFVASPSKRIAVPNQVQVQVNRRCSKLPCKPRGERRFSDPVSAIDRDQQGETVGTQALLYLVNEGFTPRKRRFYNHFRRQLFANAAIAASRVGFASPLQIDEVWKAECRNLRPIGMVLDLPFEIGHVRLQDHPHQLTE